jgi:hypothetical protein
MGRGACTLVAAKLKRLKELIARRGHWNEEIRSVRVMHARVLAAEQILSGEALRASGLLVSNATVGQRFDAWCATLREQISDSSLSPSERRCLEHFVQVTANMRPQLRECYDLALLPRTNNDMEGFIRAIKTREEADQRAQELEGLSVALWEAGGLLRSRGADE